MSNRRLQKTAIGVIVLVKTNQLDEFLFCEVKK